MSVLFVALPVALVMAAVAVIAFAVSVRRGQFDDLDTPPVRMLFDDPPLPHRNTTDRDRSAATGGASPRSERREHRHLGT